MKRFLVPFAIASAMLVAAFAPLSVSSHLIISPQTALASIIYQCPDGTSQTGASYATACANHMATPSQSPAPGGGACPSGDVQLSVPIFSGQNCVAPTGGSVIVTYVVLLLKFIGGAIGAVIVLMLMIAGIQYITSAGDPGAVKNAKDRITNAITALILFAFMYAILNFLIPGGIFT